MATINVTIIPDGDRLILSARQGNLRYTHYGIANTGKQVYETAGYDLADPHLGAALRLAAQEYNGTRTATHPMQGGQSFEITGCRWCDIIRTGPAAIHAADA